MPHFWKGFVVVCGRCGHRNRPHPSPRKGIALALLDKLPVCRGGCGRQLSFCPDETRPLVREVKCDLIRAGFLMSDGQIVDPPPTGCPLEVVEQGNWRKQLSNSFIGR